MKITEIYLDGFKNIRDTCLDFSKDPIIVLLAPNNFGKSNLLLGIQESFNFIRSQGTAVVDYIRSISYVDKFLPEEHKRPFIFGVKFYKRKKNRLYHYTFTIDGKKVKINEHDKDGSAFGIRHELLEYIDIDKNPDAKLTEPNKLPGGEILFSRSLKFNERNDIYAKNLAIATIGSLEKKVNILHSTKSHVDDDGGEKPYPASYCLFLHKLGNTVCKGEKEKTTDKWSTTLKEISGVLTSLTRENIGSIISGEGSVYNAPSNLAIDAQKLEAEEKEQRTKTSAIEGEYTFFKTRFLKIFDTFNDFTFPDIGSEKYEISFTRKIGKPENISTLSYGTRRAFKLLSQICLNQTPLVSIEEIETGLHPALYREVLNVFFDCLDEKNYNIRNNYDSQKVERRPEWLRKNEPRLIISSHAPGVVDVFVGRYKAVYIGRIKDGGVTFRFLNNAGVNDACEFIDDGRGNLGFGAFIFERFYSPVSKEDAARELL